jgi:hypothetical protein
LEDTPHIVVRAFEQLILFPLDLCMLAAGVIFLIGRAWLFGAFLLLVSLLLGVVGQGLPHRKRQTARQLYSQNVGKRYGDISREDSRGLGIAIVWTTLLVGLVLGAAAHHHSLSWYWVWVIVVGSWCLFPVASIVFCVAWSWAMEKIYGQRRYLR